ncbi:hypothetical protein AAHC03_09121 [Spirometra sp. Aus1]
MSPKMLSMQPQVYHSANHIFPDELPIQQAEVDAAVDPKVQKPKSSPTEEQVAAAEETGEVAARATITSEQAAEEVE